MLNEEQNNKTTQSFEEKYSFRCYVDIIEQAKDNVKKNPKYTNLSHYIRVALIQLNKREYEDDQNDTQKN